MIQSFTLLRLGVGILQEEPKNGTGGFKKKKKEKEGEVFFLLIKGETK